VPGAGSAVTRNGGDNLDTKVAQILTGEVEALIALGRVPERASRPSPGDEDAIAAARLPTGSTRWRPTSLSRKVAAQMPARCSGSTRIQWIIELSRPKESLRVRPRSSAQQRPYRDPHRGHFHRALIFRLIEAELRAALGMARHSRHLVYGPGGQTNRP